MTRRNNFTDLASLVFANIKYGRGESFGGRSPTSCRFRLIATRITTIDRVRRARQGALGYVDAPPRRIAKAATCSVITAAAASHATRIAELRGDSDERAFDVGSGRDLAPL
jgi:hypothetical protein